MTLTGKGTDIWGDILLCGSPEVVREWGIGDGDGGAYSGTALKAEGSLRQK